MRLRNQKKLKNSDDSEDSKELLDSGSENDSLNESEENEIIGEENHYPVSKKSPYKKVRQELDELKESNATKTPTIRKRRETGSSRSIKNNLGKKESPNRLLNRSLNTSSDTSSATLSNRPLNRSPNRLNKSPGQQKQILVQKSRELKSDIATESSFCNFKMLTLTLLIILILLFGVFFRAQPHLIFKEYFKSKTYEDVIKEYKSDLPGHSGTVISTAINKFNKIDTKPIVLLLYGQNQTKLQEFYVKLAGTLIRKSEDFLKNTIYKMNNSDNLHEFMEENLKNNKVVFLDGLEKMKSKKYMELYAFVDDEDSIVKKGLIVIGLHDVNVNNAIINFKKSDEMENHVRKYLRNLWNDVHTSNLEAFLNRIISFVAFVT